MRKNGFTFIEVMIAIVVFSVGVLAVLNLIVHNLSTMDKVQTKITATLLAKEGIELVYNIRDTNLQKSFARDCVLKSDLRDVAEDKICETYFSSGIDGKLFNVSFDPDKYYVVSTNPSSDNWNDIFENNRLHYITGDKLAWYGSKGEDKEGRETSFARYILFTGVVEDGKILPTNKILKVESHVLFQKGGYTGDIFLESFIGNF